MSFFGGFIEVEVDVDDDDDGTVYVGNYEGFQKTYDRDEAIKEVKKLLDLVSGKSIPMLYDDDDDDDDAAFPEVDVSTSAGSAISENDTGVDPFSSSSSSSSSSDGGHRTVVAVEDTDTARCSHGAESSLSLSSSSS